MSRQIPGLWLGGAISVEAAEIVEECVLATADRRAPTPASVRTELTNLANAIRAQIQAVPKPDPLRYL